MSNSLDAVLTFSERMRIVAQLGTAMVAAALFSVGWLQLQYGSPDLKNVAELIIAVAAIIVAIPIFWGALVGLVVRHPHSMTEQLVALAILAAMMYGEAGVMASFGTATLIAVIMNLGHFFEERSILGAQAAIDGLRTLHARKATVVDEDGTEREVETVDLQKGNILLIRPGDVIAADGDVIEGGSAVDQSSITGESTPEDIGPGSSVYAASINLTGVIRVKVTKTGGDTALGRVVELLHEAEQSKTPALKLIERYAGYYVPVILIIAAVTLFVSRDMSRAVTVLVVACPGALILAGPSAMVAALATASRLGVLIKNTRFLEVLGDVDTVVLDKTGTVTLGHLELVGFEPVGDLESRDLVQRALACAVGSRHPASRAVVHAAELADITASADKVSITEVAGKGVRSEGPDGITLLGKSMWLVEEGVAMPDDPDHVGAIVWVAGGPDASSIKPLGCLLLADIPRPDAKEAIDELRSIGVRRSILLTGDRRAVAEQIGKTLEVDEVISDVLPEQKLEVIDREKDAGGLVMMVGDGVNDAPALAQGDVGIALGAVASDIALASADVALMTNDLKRLPTTVKLARRTRLTIHQNILVGAGLSFLFVWFASIGYFTPVTGAILHFASELFVIGNSARLLGIGK